MKKVWNTNLWRWCAQIYQNLFSYWYRLKKRWFRMMFRLDGSASLRYLKCGTGLYFDVPVKVAAGKGILEIGDDVRFGWFNSPMLGNGSILLQPRSPKSVILIGESTIFSNNITIVAMGEIRVGKRCLIGDLTTVIDCDFHNLDPSLRMTGEATISPVTIGDNVWLGSRVQILRGVTIGDNTVIGTGSVVTHDIPANSVAAGVPARVIRTL